MTCSLIRSNLRADCPPALLLPGVPDVKVFRISTLRPFRVATTASVPSITSMPKVSLSATSASSGSTWNQSLHRPFDTVLDIVPGGARFYVDCGAKFFPQLSQYFVYLSVGWDVEADEFCASPLLLC